MSKNFVVVKIIKFYLFLHIHNIHIQKLIEPKKITYKKDLLILISLIY